MKTLELEYARLPRSAANQRFGKISLEFLRANPTSGRALRNFGLHREAAGDLDAANKSFLAGNAMTLRDPVTQLWLSSKSAERNDVEAAFTHLDRLLRVKPGASEVLLQRLALAMTDAGVRRAFKEFVRPENPWLAHFIEIAVRQPKLHWAIAQLFVDSDIAPPILALRTPYSQIIETLVNEERIRLLTEFYPLLPGAKMEHLQGISFDPVLFENAYPPVHWDLGQSSDRGGALVQTGNANGLELYGLADTRGTAVRKLVMPAKGASHIRWSISEHNDNKNSYGQLILKCLRRGVLESEVRSVNLFQTRPKKIYALALPSECDAILVEVLIDGGNGPDPARLVFNSLSVI